MPLGGDVPVLLFPLMLAALAFTKDAKHKKEKK